MFDEEKDGEERESRGRDGTRYMDDGRERARDAEAGVCAADMHHRKRMKEDKGATERAWRHAATGST